MRKLHPFVSFIIFIALTGLSLAACQSPAHTVVVVTAGTPQVIVQVVTATPSPATDTPAPLVPMPTATPTHEEFVRRTFAYDRAASLDIEEVSVSDRDGIQVHTISYVSPKGGRVPAYLVVPPGAGPFAGMLFMHAGGESRNEFLDEALLLAKRGAVSLLIDEPTNRPSYKEVSSSDMYVQLVMDLQRGVDLLTSRSNVDPKRIGYVGHSVGAVWGGVLAGVETRISAYVLMAGHARISRCTRCQVAVNSHLHAIYYIGQAAPASVFFQFAKRDEYITREAALEYYEACSEPKRIEWYNTDHAFNEPAQLDRAAWLSAQLGLKPRTP
jgi:dienelactone hydrolase